jgi:hypothetical protein
VEMGVPVFGENVLFLKEVRTVVMEEQEGK